MKKINKIEAILFDKDGTLFDFQTSWGGAMAEFIETATDNPTHAAELADIMKFDLGTKLFSPDSIMIAASVEETVPLFKSMLSNWTSEDILLRLDALSAAAVMMPVPKLVETLEFFAELNIPMGVVTNDGEFSARAHVKRAGIERFFDDVIGYDSGFTSKPEPDMLLSFAHKFDIVPDSIVMVGDSTHDLIAGRAAGMMTVGVLTGVAGREDLAPYADLVINDISFLPESLAGKY